MTEPKTGTNIRFVWRDVLTDKYTLLADLKQKLAEKAPHIPAASVTVHLDNLIKRGYALRKESVHGYLYRSHLSSSTDTPSSHPVDALWAAIELRVGDHITAALVATITGEKNVNYNRMLNALAKRGCLEKVTINRKCHYIVLPSDNTKAIAPLPTIEPYPIKEPDIMSMSIGDLFLQAKQLNDENVRLKTTLENIAQLLVSAGIVE